MTDKTPINHSYSSVSTIEPFDFNITRPSSRPWTRVSSTGSNVSWHPKLTLYRALVILSTVGLAAAKTATSFLNLTFTSITLEWILGVVVFLFFYLLGVYEELNHQYFRWLFDSDCMDFLWASLENLTGFSRPYYISDEIDARRQAAAGIYLTGYRILVTVVVASVGMTKSALLYGQLPREATTMECLFGVWIVNGLYYLGLYEASSTKVYPKLFHVDYSGALLLYITETAIVFFALLFCGALSYGLYHAAAMIFSPGVPTKSKMEIIEDFVMKANSLFMNLLQEAPWYGSLIYIFISFLVIPALLVAISVVIYFVYKGFKNFFSRPGSTLL